jgi:hypothetical protein
MSAFPHIYLFGTLVELEAFTVDAQAAALWKARRDEVMDEIWRYEQFYRGGAQAMKIPGPTP